MKNERIVYVIGGNPCGYDNWMEITGYTRDMREADLILGLGGADWSPEYYNEVDSGCLSCSPSLDKVEWAEFNKAIDLGKKIIGVCRSSQIAPVLSGKRSGHDVGKICQDVRHPSMHLMENVYGEAVEISSSHHNLQWPFNLPKENYKILGWANLSPYHIGGDGQEMVTPVDPELVWYKNINFLAKQPHVEWLYEQKQYSKTVSLFRKILDDFMEDNLD